LPLGIAGRGPLVIVFAVVRAIARGLRFPEVPIERRTVPRARDARHRFLHEFALRHALADAARPTDLTELSLLWSFGIRGGSPRKDNSPSRGQFEHHFVLRANDRQCGSSLPREFR